MCSRIAFFFCVVNTQSQVVITAVSGPDRNVDLRRPSPARWEASVRYMNRVATGVVSVAAMTASLVLVSGPADAADPRIDLKVLVVSDGGPSVSAIEDRLQVEGVPHRTVDLSDASRPVIDKAFLEDTVSGVPRAKYQAVVLPNA